MFILADLHLTDRPRDEYRWQLFPWLARQMERKDDQTVLILGDLTDEKDRHSAKLVNMVMDALLDLPGDVFVLQGNHDYVDHECAFFSFLSRPDVSPQLSFIAAPTYLEGLLDVSETVLMLPHTNNPGSWDELELDGVGLICTHQTYGGADAGQGSEVAGSTESVLA